MARLRRKHGPERPARVAQRRSQQTLMELVQRGKRRRRQRQPPESVPPLREPRLARLRLQKSQRVQKRGSPPLRGKFGGKPRGKEASFVLPEKKSTNQVTEDSPCQISITRKKVARKQECGFPSTCRNSISSRKSARRPA